MYDPNSHTKLNLIDGINLSIDELRKRLCKMDTPFDPDQISKKYYANLYNHELFKNEKRKMIEWDLNNDSNQFIQTQRRTIDHFNTPDPWSQVSNRQPKFPNIPISGDSNNSGFISFGDTIEHRDVIQKPQIPIQNSTIQNPNSPHSQSGNSSPNHEPDPDHNPIIIEDVKSNNSTTYYIKIGITVVAVTFGTFLILKYTNLLDNLKNIDINELKNIGIENIKGLFTEEFLFKNWHFIAVLSGVLLIYPCRTIFFRCAAWEILNKIKNNSYGFINKQFTKQNLLEKAIEEENMTEENFETNIWPILNTYIENDKSFRMGFDVLPNNKTVEVWQLV